MDEYQLGKDVGGILARLDALENHAQCECRAKRLAKSQRPVPIRLTRETKVNEAAGHFVASKSWTFDVNRLDDCELRPGGSLTLFSDGRFRAIGSRKCNAGGIISCKEHIVAVAFWAGGDAQCQGAVVVGQYDVADGLLGPGSEFPFQKDASDGNLQPLFDQIHCASMWVRQCDTGV